MIPIIKIPLPTPVLGFRPPLVGFDGDFNTLRLGKKWASELEIHQTVLLVDERAKQAFGIARVRYLHVGELVPICKAWGYDNHTQLGKSKRAAAVGVLEVIRSMYGPHIAIDTKLTTAIGLTRIA